MHALSPWAAPVTFGHPSEGNDNEMAQISQRPASRYGVSTPVTASWPLTRNTWGTPPRGSRSAIADVLHHLEEHSARVAPFCPQVGQLQVCA